MLKELEQILKEKISVKNEVFPCIYFLIDEEEVVYVGQSIYGLQRILIHHCQGEKKFAHYHVVTCKQEELNNLEARYIVAYNPKYNGSLPQNDFYKSMYQIKRILQKDGYEMNDILRKHNIKTIFARVYDLPEMMACLGGVK